MAVGGDSVWASSGPPVLCCTLGLSIKLPAAKIKTLASHLLQCECQWVADNNLTPKGPRKVAWCSKAPTKVHKTAVMQAPCSIDLI